VTSCVSTSSPLVPQHHERLALVLGGPQGRPSWLKLRRRGGSTKPTSSFGPCPVDMGLLERVQVGGERWTPSTPPTAQSPRITAGGSVLSRGQAMLV
jgi:hypothetical protein